MVQRRVYDKSLARGRAVVVVHMMTTKIEDLDGTHRGNNRKILKGEKESNSQ